MKKTYILKYLFMGEAIEKEFTTLIHFSIALEQAMDTPEISDHTISFETKER